MPSPYAITLPLPALPVGDQLDYAVRAERAGYRSCWLAESANADSFSLGGAIAAATGLELATGIVSVFTRTPMVLAMSAATMSELSGGRFSLGLGVSTRTVVEGWHGLDYAKPLTRTRETLDVLRPLLAGERVDYEGELLSVHGARLEAPPAVPPPIHLAALNKRMLRLAGERADGVIINLLGPEHLPILLAEVEAGAAAAGRDLAELEVVLRLLVVLDQDEAEVARRARAFFAPYVAASGYSRFLRWIGFEAEVEEVSAGLAERSRERTRTAISDRLIDALVVHGDADACRRRFAEYEAAGATKIVLSPLTDSAAECDALLAAFAAA
jgi:probable F420-dependent oxidoreductase